MPLDREHITRASLVMLPTYVGMFVVLGCGYMLIPNARALSNPPLAYADSVLPLTVWGGLFLAIGLLMAVSLMTRHRTAFRYALSLGSLCMGIWTVVFVVAAFNSATTPIAWVYPAVITLACHASNRSLTKGEFG
jgi:hypothetical protein